MATIQQLFDLTGKTAIVTGGAMGIGRGIALRLSEAGANVVVADLDQEVAGKTAAGLPGSSIAVRTDVSKEDDVVKMVERAAGEFGGVDIMINNAGIYPQMPAVDMTGEDWDRVLDINLKGTFFCAREAAKKMIAQNRGGRIVNIASIDSVHPSFPGLLAYEASKGGVKMFTKGLALELAPHKIQVNAIAPGAIMTRAPGADTPKEMIEAYIQKIPLKRMGEPDDIARMALFLASEASAYMTGSFIVVDGGILLT